MKEVIEILQENLELEKEKIEELIEKPKLKEHGDFSFPCFILAKIMKNSPQKIAEDLVKKIQINDNFSNIKAVGPYINFYLNNSKVAQEIAEEFISEEILEYKEEPKTILIEYPSPNTNKALHIGHSRNMFLGNTLSNLLISAGHNLIRTNLNNDRGIAVCKAMLSYKLFGDNSTPEDMNMKPDEFVSYWYVQFGKKADENPELNKQAQEMLKKWEEGDTQVKELWKKLLNWVYEGYEQTYLNYRVDAFDKEFFESEIYDKGKDIVLKALDDKCRGFSKDGGAVYVDLEDKNLGQKYLLREDGTTLYMTQDLYLAKLKESLFNPDLSIFVVGQEQEYHFSVLFELLDRINTTNTNNYHFSYGYVYDENGKKFSSRLGETIGADEILDIAVEKAKINLQEKELTKDLDEEEISKRAEKIGFCALAFSFLKTNPNSSIHFSIDQALSFEGETGAYVQYTYARIQSLLSKGEFEFSKHWDVSVLSEKELEHIKLFKEAKQAIEEATQKYKLSAIANYVLKLSQSFNDLYSEVSFTKEKDSNIKYSRLYLAYATGFIIQEMMGFYSIDLLDEM